MPRPPCRRPTVTPAAIGRLARVLVALLASVTAGLGTSPWARADAPPSAGGNQAPQVTFGIQPATATGPNGNGIFDLAATPGASITQYAAVTNHSDQELHLALHATDATNTDDGSFALQPPTKPVRDVGAWVHVTPDVATLDLGPQAQVVVPFTVVVPDGATPGDHVGGLIATLQSQVTGPGQNIQLLQSVGARIFLRVSGPVHPRLSVRDLQVSYQGTLDPIGEGGAVVRFTVANTGNIALGGQQTVTVTGLFGSRVVAKSLPNVQLLLPGAAVTETVHFRDDVVPELRMHAHVSITALVVPGSAEPPTPAFVADRAFWAVPWTLVAAVIGLLLVVALLVRRRRRRRRSGGPGDGGPGVAPIDGDGPPASATLAADDGADVDARRAAGAAS